MPSDKELLLSIKNKWVVWDQYLPCLIEIPRAITNINQKLLEIALHLFGDASMIGTRAVAYDLIKQSSIHNTGFHIK